MEVVIKRKVIVDFDVQFPINMKPEQVSGIIRDYIHCLRFVVGMAEVSMYLPDNKIVQKAIKIVSNESVN